MKSFQEPVTGHAPGGATAPRGLFEDKISSWVLYVGLVCLISAVCFGSLRHHEIYFHDDETFRDNAAISRDFSFFFSTEKEQFTGRPIAELVKWMAFTVVGNDPGASHLVVVCFHTLASVMLALLWRRMGIAIELAFLGGILFLADVSHFHTVHHISALDYPLGLVWGVLAALAYLRYLPTRRVAWLAGTCGALIAGVASHLAMVALWPFLIYWAWHQGLRPDAVWRHQLALGSVLALSCGYLLSITPTDTTTGQALDHYTTAGWPDLLAGSGRMVLWMVSRLFTTAHWLPLTLFELRPWELYLGGGLLVALLWLAWRRVFPLSVWGAWLLLFSLPFALVSEDVSIKALEGPSHYLYLASAGSALMLAQLVQRWGLWLRDRLGAWGNLLYGGCVIALLASSFVALKRVEAFSYYNSGRYLRETDLEKAVQCLQRALAQGEELLNLREAAYARLAMACPLVGKDPMPILRDGLALFPNSFNLNIAMAVVETDSADPATRSRGERRLRTTQEHAERVGAMRAFAYNTSAMYHNLGRGYAGRGDPARAIRLYERAMEFTLDPDKTIAELSEAYVMLGLQHERLGRLDEASTAYRAALELNPNHEVAWEKLRP